MLRARLVALAEDDSRINELESDFHARKTPKLEYVSEQATLLHFVATLMGDKEATSYVDFHHSEVREGEQPPLLLPEGVLAFVLDTTSVVATRFALTEDEDERDVALSLLMECVEHFAADERARSQAPHRRHDRVLSCDGSRAFSFVSSRRVTATGRYWSDKQGDGTRLGASTGSVRTGRVEK